MHLSDAFIQCNLHCIKFMHLLGIKPMTLSLLASRSTVWATGMHNYDVFLNICIKFAFIHLRSTVLQDSDLFQFFRLISFSQTHNSGKHHFVRWLIIWLKRAVRCVSPRSYRSISANASSQHEKIVWQTCANKHGPEALRTTSEWKEPSQGKTEASFWKQEHDGRISVFR